MFYTEDATSSPPPTFSPLLSEPGLIIDVTGSSTEVLREHDNTGSSADDLNLTGQMRRAERKNEERRARELKAEEEEMNAKMEKIDHDEKKNVDKIGGDGRINSVGSAKRKAAVKLEAIPASKSRRMTSPSTEPMEVGTPTHLVESPMAQINSVLNSTSLTDQLPDLATPTPTPRRTRSRFNLQPTDGMSRAASRPRRPTSAPPSPASEMFPLDCRSVHDLFPLNFCPVPLELRVDTAANPRPDYPYPFTGRVREEDKKKVRNTLERDWTEEYLRQLNPTVGTLARTLQYRTQGRYTAGWRRSRFNGEWLYFGPAADPGALASETEVVGRQRVEAARLVDREVDQREEARWAEARAANFAKESVARVKREERRALLRAERLVREANIAWYGHQGGASMNAVPPPPEMRPRSRPASPRAPILDQRRPEGRPASTSRNAPARDGPARRGGRMAALQNTERRVCDNIVNDQWLKVLAQKAAQPDLYSWKHRNRVMEIVLTQAHPDRDHIRRCLDSEETRAQQDAMALLRTEQITGAAASLDTSWPPKDSVRIVMNGPGWAPTRGRDDESSESSEAEADRWSPPPPYCEAQARRNGGRRDDDLGGNGAGRPIPT